LTEAELLGALAPLVFQAALLFARLSAAAMLLPGIGEQEVPPAIRLGLALALLPLLLPGLAAELPGMPETPIEAMRLLALETLVGVWLGGLARLIVLALAIAGQQVAAMIGLASVLVQDPTLGQGGTALSRLFGLLAAVLVLSSGLYAVPLAALAQSYQVLPAGLAWPGGAAAETVARVGAESLALATRLAAPFLLAALLCNLALGLLARLAPQVQVYFVAVPGQVLAGIALLALLTPSLLGVWAEAARAAFQDLPGAR
jgi:flagellar biosynthetic protein FliR